MKTTRQISRTRLRSVLLAPALAFVLVLVIGAKSAQAQTLNVLYTFTGQADGAQPIGGLIRDSQGNLYGTTCCAGTHGAGTVFMLDKAGTETVLYSFCSLPNCPDGDQPYASLIRDADGSLYGTTYFGGSTECSGGCGVVFKLDKSGNETVLHAFTGTGGDGSNPYDGLVQDPKGNFYGTTEYGGGASACSGGCGTVFEVDAAGKERVLYSFSAGTDGVGPLAGLVRDDEGNLYGTTQYGGTYGVGTVFKLDNAHREEVLYTFTGGADGGQPLLGYLVRDAKGNLYGTTVRGGASSCSFLCGVVFKLDKSGKETVLHGFVLGTDDGTNPYAGLVEDAEGNLYGTTNQGGAYGKGMVFELDKSGKETLLHTFTGTGDGAYPSGDLLRTANGKLYGTAADGADSGCYDDLGCGIVFMLTPN